MTPLNLDQEAALSAQQMVAAALTVKKDAKAIENLITKTLGVLQEQGVYACMLFLFSRTSSDERGFTGKIRPVLYDLLGKLPAFGQRADLPTWQDESKKVLEFYARHVCQELDSLLLARDLYEQALIYARFTAKAERKGD
ncbi:MAG: hypothetical protein FJ011_15325 [Chloroflexi bacterium]|nr:hypothetical protein [Chloroflexota bacterium]